MFGIIIFSLVIGGVNALRGSDWLDQKIWKHANIIVKWGFTPLLMWIAASAYDAPLWLSLLFIFPYLWKMGTGTGGDMLAWKPQQPCNPDLCQEWKYFDAVAAKAAKLTGDYESYDWNYCHRWGFAYCLLSSVIFMIPFWFTNFWCGLVMLHYPFINRYLNHRAVEFLWMAIYIAFFLGSL